MLKNKTLFIVALSCIFLLGDIAVVNANISEDSSDDLAVESIAVFPTRPTAGQKTTVTVKVKNNGTKNKFDSIGLTALQINFPDYVKTSMTYNSPTMANYVAPGGYITFYFDGKFSSVGEKELSFTVNADDSLLEKSDTNNTLKSKITVYSENDNDLSITSLVFDKSEITIRSNVTMTVTLNNSGKTTLVNSLGFVDSQISYYLPQFQYEVGDLTHDEYPSEQNPLDPGETFKYYLTGYFNKPGDKTVTFSFDKNNELAESNNNNNSTSTIIHVYDSQEQADDFSLLDYRVEGISSTSVSICWETSQEATGKVSYNESNYVIRGGEISAPNSSKTQSVALTNLLPGTQYDYRILITNGVVEKTPVFKTFTTIGSEKLAFMAAPSATTDKANKQATINWKTNLKSIGKVYYKKSGASSYSSVNESTQAIEHNTLISKLDAAKYEYYIGASSTLYASAISAKYYFDLSTSSAITPATQKTAGGNNIQTQGSQTVKRSKGPLFEKMKGKIVLKVQSAGEAYYINPSGTIVFLGRPQDAFEAMRKNGIGISDKNLDKIAVSTKLVSGQDADKDGLPDALEDAIKTDKNKADTDGDGYGDKAELEKGYSPIAKNTKLGIDNAFSKSGKGKIFLQIESKGQAWYVSPADTKRYFLGRPNDAFEIMRKLGVGISNADFDKI